MKKHLKKVNRKTGGHDDCRRQKVELWNKVRHIGLCGSNDWTCKPQFAELSGAANQDDQGDKNCEQTCVVERSDQLLSMEH